MLQRIMKEDLAHLHWPATDALVWACEESRAKVDELLFGSLGRPIKSAFYKGFFSVQKNRV